MMIINLNLLPPSRRAKLNRLIKFLFIKNLLEFLIIAAAVIAIILLWGWIILIDEFNSLAQNSIAISRDYTAYNMEIRQINKTIKALENATVGYLPITPKILDIISTTPSNIRINSLDISRIQGKIVIAGTALRRENLLSYQEIWKNITWLASVALPTTQLLQKENVNFEFQANLKNWPKLPDNAPASAPTRAPAE